MAGYVDIHAHVLPGIDDGPSRLGDSIEMAQAAVASGIVAIAATPHIRSDFPDVDIDELAERCDEMRIALADADVALELIGGTECSLMWAIDAGEDELRQATYGQRGKDLLIETPTGPVLAMDHLLYDVRSRGIRVTLAHPERSPEFQRDVGPLRELVNQGVLLQVNAESLLSNNRRSGTRRLAELLCSEGLAHALASDGHRAASWRPVTKLSEGVRALAALVGADRAQWMASAVPRAIVDGAELPAPPPIEIARRRRWPFNKG